MPGLKTHSHQVGEYSTDIEVQEVDKEKEHGGEDRDRAWPQILLTRKTILLLKRGFRYGEFFQAHPFHWNERTGLPEVVESKWRRALWMFNVIFTFAYSSFVAIRSMQTYASEDATNAKKVYMQFMAAYFFYPSIFQIASIYNQREIPTMVARNLRFIADFERQFVVTKEHRKKLAFPGICYLAMFGFFINLNFMSCLMTIASFARPHSPEFLSSLFENPKGLSVLEKMPTMVFMAYFEYLYHSQCFMLAFAAFTLIFPSLTIIDELNPSTCRVTVEELRTNSEHRLHVYKCVGLNLNIFNCIAGKFFIPLTKIILILIVIFCVYGSIKMQGIQAIMLSITLVVVLLTLAILFGFCAEFHSRSTDVLLSFRQDFHELWQGEERKWVRKVVESLTVLKVTLGSFYYVDRGMVFTMFDTVLEESVNFLLVNS